MATPCSTGSPSASNCPQWKARRWSSSRGTAPPGVSTARSGGSWSWSPAAAPPRNRTSPTGSPPCPCVSASARRRHERSLRSVPVPRSGGGGAVTARRWAETDRETLRGLLPEALVLLAIGATEQHGPHLATGTDALIAATTCERAADAAADRARRPLVVVPALPYGASDHHLPFGGTLSLAPETLLAVLGDLARSLAAQGGRRLVLVNGHGGNIGICRTFAEA